MIYFDSDMSKSTNTVVYFDWKTVIYIYVCRKCRTQFMLPMEKSVTFTGACANEIIPSINRSFVYKAKEGSHVRIKIRYLLCIYLFIYLSNHIPIGVISGFIFSTDQSTVSLLFLIEYTPRPMSDWFIYLYVLHMIGRSKMNIKLPDIITKRFVVRRKFIVK